MATLKITLTKSLIGQKPVNVKTARALGLTKIGKTVEQKDNPAIRGMLQRVRHMVKVGEVQ